MLLQRKYTAEDVVNRRFGIVVGVGASHQQEMMLACRSMEIPRPTFRFQVTHHITNIVFNFSTPPVRPLWRPFAYASLAFRGLSNTNRLLEALALTTYNSL